MTREEYYDALKTFDWYYEMSDSGVVWAKRDTQFRALKAEAEQDPGKKKMFAAFCDYYSSSRLLKPTREEFGL